MGKIRKFIGSVDVMVDEETGALLVEMTSGPEIDIGDVDMTAGGRLALALAALLAKQTADPATATLQGTGNGSLGSILSAVGIPTVITGGEKTVGAAATPDAIVGTSTPCKFVWIGAPVTQSTGAAENTKLAYIGGTGAGNQRIPLTPANFEGFFLKVADAAAVFAKVGVNGEKVRWLAFA